MDFQVSHDLGSVAVIKGHDMIVPKFVAAALGSGDDEAMAAGGDAPACDQAGHHC